MTYVEIDKETWDAQPFGKKSDPWIARRLNTTPHRVARNRQARGIGPAQPKNTDAVNWDEQPLGKMTDIALGEKLGCSKTRVRTARIARGIPPFYDQTIRVDWPNAGLGEDTDENVANRLGCSIDTVYRHRKALGIDAYADTERLRNYRAKLPRPNAANPRRGNQEKRPHWNGDYFAIRD